MKHRNIGRWAVVVTGLTLAAAAAADSPAITERVEVRRVRIAALFDEKTLGACATLSGSNIEVKEDGQSVGDVYLEPGRLETLHAVMIDTGSSMLGNLAAFRKTTAAHITELPDSEPALLATFDDSLALHAPLSTDRQRFKLGLDWIETADGKYLWDATRQMVRYLHPLSGRKVLLLLTDGCDTQRVAAVAAESAIDEARRSESVVVFAIGVGMPALCPVTRVDPAEGLRDLAQATGGEFHVLNKADGLGAVMAGIRKRLDSERVLQYEPLPFGEGPRDHPEENTHRYRKLQLSVSNAPGCRGRLAGAPTRYESSSRGLFNPGYASVGNDGPSFLDAGGGRLEAGLVDVVQDGGAPPSMMGLMRPSGTSEPRRTAKRRVAAVIPSLDSVVRFDAGPETVVFNALAAVARSPLGTPEPLFDSEQTAWTDVPFLVNGRTLLDTRPALARALAQHPDYGSWALQRVGSARLAALDRLIDQAATPESRSALEAARASLSQHSWNPEPGELEAYLGAWLGDVRAPVMFNAAETWLARRVLGVTTGGHLDRLNAGATEAERLWKVVSGWFPPAQGVRVVGLLVPGYDAERDLVGYYRVTLKQSAAFAINSTISAFDPTKLLESETGGADHSLYSRLQSLNYSRNAPLGVRMIRWMMEQELVRPMMEGKAVASIRYATSTNRDLYPLLMQLGLTSPREGSRSYPARLVTLTLSDRDNPDDTLEVSAYFPTLPDDSSAFADAPGCVVLPDRIPREGPEFELFGALYAAKKYSSFPCVFQAGVDAQAGARPSGG